MFNGKVKSKNRKNGTVKEMDNTMKHIIKDTKVDGISTEVGEPSNGKATIMHGITMDGVNREEEETMAGVANKEAMMAGEASKKAIMAGVTTMDGDISLENQNCYHNI